MAQESPPPRVRRHLERHQELLPLDPTRVDPVDDLTASLMKRRPRDWTSSAGKTWRGFGGHGEGKEEEEDLEGVDDPRLETADESFDGVDGSDESDEALDRLDEAVEGVEVDQELEDLERVDLLQHPRQ